MPGVPGHDYPLYHSVPKTSFSCDHVPHRPGMYANVETGCQVNVLLNIHVNQTEIYLQGWQATKITSFKHVFVVEFYLNM